MIPEYYYYGLAVLMYVTTCLMFAAVRWFHVCPDTKAHKDYYYPARRVVSLSYLMPVILLPYIFNPQSHEAWLLIKCFLPLINFYVCALLMFTYFGKMKRWHRWQTSGRVATVLTLGTMAVLLGVTLWPDYHLTAGVEQTLTSVVVIVALLMTVYSFVAAGQVWRWIREFNTDNYSNPDDFPKSYAQHVLFVPAVQTVLIWPVMLLDSPWYAIMVYLLSSLFNVVFLISILSPKRENDPISKMVEHTESEEKNAPPPLPLPKPGSCLKTSLQNTSRCQMRLMKR